MLNFRRNRIKVWGKQMSKSIWKIKEEILKSQTKREYVGHAVMMNNKFQYYHYTSLSVLFSILDGDAFWASNVRFSNDAMEEKMLNLRNSYKRDDYVICFCSENDKLSQWRGYCYNGGAAIKLDLRSPIDYSILHANYDENREYEICENAPLPVVYVAAKANPDQREKDIISAIEVKGKGTDIHIDDILPYLKNGRFYEEKESRLVFSNVQGRLSKCIRFRTLQNGAKVPYIVVKNGDIGKMNGNCTMDMSQLTDDFLYNHMISKTAIWVQEGTDQESKYYEVLDRINKYEKDNPNQLQYPFRVFCRGHLPIEEIMVAPTYDSERIAEQVERFCMSKFWLRRVKVKRSDIPYIKPMV